MAIINIIKNDRLNMRKLFVIITILFSLSSCKYEYPLGEESPDLTSPAENSTHIKRYKDSPNNNPYDIYERDRLAKEIIAKNKK